MPRRKNLKRLTTIARGDQAVVGLGRTEIWDGADLSLLRETISKLYAKDRCRRVDLDMEHVQYVPSGFFGMLCDWHDRGMSIRVLSPTPRVQRMLWFVTFFRETSDACHQLSLEVALNLDDRSREAFEQLVLPTAQTKAQPRSSSAAALVAPWSADYLDHEADLIR